MERFTGLIGILLIFGIALFLSDNRKAINLRLVFSGLVLQIVLAVLILKVHVISSFFEFLGKGMTKLEHFAVQGASFIYGGIMVDHGNGSLPYGLPHTFVFAFTVTANIIFVSVLVAVLYHLGIIQKIVAMIARFMNFIIGASSAEALSNVASAFVGQVEAQILIKPYLRTMTPSELLSSMAGSMACIAGGILIVYVNMGAKAEYLLAASLMAIPGAIVISKIILPETGEPMTKGDVKLKVEKEYSNIIDAIAHGSETGMRIALSVMAVLIGFVALIAFVNYGLGKVYPELSLDYIFGKLFYPMAWCMGVPDQDVQQVAVLMGQKLSINEFIAFRTMTTLPEPLSNKGLIIASFAICGFANFGSVGMQIAGIGALAPERRKELAKLGVRALISGTLASYLSAAIAGILM